MTIIKCEIKIKFLGFKILEGRNAIIIYFICQNICAGHRLCRVISKWSVLPSSQAALSTTVPSWCAQDDVRHLLFVQLKYLNGSKVKLVIFGVFVSNYKGISLTLWYNFRLD